MNLSERVKMYIANEIARDVKAEAIPDDYNLVENGLIDSLSMVRLISWMGDTCGINIDDIEINPEDLSSIRSIVKFITKNQKIDA